MNQKKKLGLIAGGILFMAACLNAPRMAGDLYTMERAAIAECKDGPRPGCYARGECVQRIKITLLGLQEYADAVAAGRTPTQSAIMLRQEFEATRTFCAARGVAMTKPGEGK